MNAECGVRSAEFSEARELQWTWKTPAMEAMAVAICKLALERGAAREFSANDLPIHTAIEHGGTGICGSIFKRLLEDGVLVRAGMFDSERKFQPKIAVNAGGNKIGVYRLANHAKAATLIKLHSRVVTNAATELKQTDFLSGGHSVTCPT